MISSWGRDAITFYSHILSIIYSQPDCDAVYIARDLNDRIGDMKDFIPGLDNVPERVIIDKTKNSWETSN